MKYGFLIVWSIFVLSCKLKKEQPDWIPVENMSKIIAEMELSQAVCKFQNTDGDIESLFQQIYNKYNITKEEFDENLKHYSENPNSMEEIYNVVITILSNEQAKVEAN